MPEILTAFIDPFFDNLAAQLVGVVALLIIIVSYQFNDRKHIVFLQFFSGIFFSIHYLMLGAATGGIINIIGVIRAAVYYYKGKYKWSSVVLWPILFSASGFVIAVFTWQGVLSLLPALAFTCTGIALWIQKPRLTRVFFMSSSVLFIIYNFISTSYSGVLTETIAICSLLIAVVRFDILKLQDKNN